jgi:tyrosinase
VSSSCQNPKLRQEWRTLSTEQQDDYINAVRCLQHIPSKLHPGMSLYDDFPFVHDVLGEYGMSRNVSGFHKPTTDNIL